MTTATANLAIIEEVKVAIEKTVAAIENINVSISGKALFLAGKTKSFYHKQLAQDAAQNIVDKQNPPLHVTCENIEVLEKEHSDLPKATL